jgi:hypothetical protein
MFRYHDDWKLLATASAFTGGSIVNVVGQPCTIKTGPLFRDIHGLHRSGRHGNMQSPVVDPRQQFSSEDEEDAYSTASN